MVLHCRTTKKQQQTYFHLKQTITSSWTTILIHFSYWRILVSVTPEQQIFSKRRLNKCTTMSDKALEKESRGHVDQRKPTNGGACRITLIGWNNNHAIYIASNSLP